VSIKDVFESGLSQEVEKLKKENQEVHAAVIRKHKELMKIRMSLVTECCPHCGEENTIEWDVSNRGYIAFCPNCGKTLCLCSECLIERSLCDWNSNTGLCYRMVENFWRNLEDVTFFEEEDGSLVLASEYALIVKEKRIALFPAGTTREEIWHWFDEHHPKGVVYLLREWEVQDEDRIKGKRVIEVVI